MTAFKMVYVTGVLSYAILIMFPKSELLTYLANIMLITSVGGWFNV